MKTEESPFSKLRVQVSQKARHKGVREGARPPSPPTASTYRRASQPSLPSGRCLPTAPVRPSAPPSQVPTARASHTSRTFSRQARCQTRMQGSDLAWREGVQSLCTSRTQRKRNRTTYLPSFPKKTSPSRRSRLREAESRRRSELEGVPYYATAARSASSSCLRISTTFLSSLTTMAIATAATKQSGARTNWALANQPIAATLIEATTAQT